MSEITAAQSQTEITPRPKADKVAGRFAVADLKKGESLNFGQMMAEEEGGAQSLRRRFGSGRVAPSPRRAQNSMLTPGEQVEKLAKIRNSAVEYESVFVDQLVKQMRQSPLAKTPGGDTFSDIAEQPFRDFLSQAGGLGLADVIVTRIANEEGLEDTLRAHPEIMRPGYQQKLSPSQLTKGAGRPTAEGGNLAPPPARAMAIAEDSAVLPLRAQSKPGLEINRTPKKMNLPGRRAPLSAPAEELRGGE